MDTDRRRHGEGLCPASQECRALWAEGGALAKGWVQDVRWRAWSLAFLKHNKLLPTPHLGLGCAICPQPPPLTFSRQPHLLLLNVGWRKKNSPLGVMVGAWWGQKGKLRQCR